MPKIKQEDMVKAMKQSPNVGLAFGRTDMANERTFLSFLRTSLGLLGGGLGIVGFVEHRFVVTLGWFAIILAIPLLVWGIWRYIKMKRLLAEVGREIFSATDKIAAKLFISPESIKNT